MVKRYLEGDDVKLYETVKECLETAIKEDGVTECYYDFTADGNCGYELFESSGGHVVTPNEMVRIAEKFFGEFGWVHFEGLGKDGNVSISCYLAEETKDSLTEKRVKRDKERKQKLFAEWKNTNPKDRTKENYEKFVSSWKERKEWEEK